jgi:hypothetical protein
MIIIGRVSLQLTRPKLIHSLFKYKMRRKVEPSFCYPQSQSF